MRSVPSNASAAAYALITQKIVTLIEAGAPAFQMPWHVPTGIRRPSNLLTARGYRGINVVLWAEDMTRNYPVGVWGAYRQWLQAKAQVRKGEHGTMIVVHQPAGPDAQRQRRLFLRHSTVFNQQQVEGWHPPEEGERSTLVRLDAVEVFVSATGACVRHGGCNAAYDRSCDHILMPEPDAFVGTTSSTALESYYSTLLHD